MIERGEGTDLIDADGRRYIDGVSSLWCNVHGHRHPAIDEAVSRAARPGRALDDARPHPSRRRRARLPPGRDRPAGPRARLLLGIGVDRGRDRPEDGLPVLASGADGRRRTEFVTFTDAYHGDTIGSVSVGGIDLFHGAYGPLLFKTRRVDRGDARRLERVLELHGHEIGAVIVEPLVQGAAGIRLQPPGFLRRIRELCSAHDVFMIADEVATGFGRTGTMFACEQRAGGAGLPLPRQGHHRRLHAARRDAHDRARLRGLPRSRRGAAGRSSTATPTRATHSPARPRSRASTSSAARGRSLDCSRRSGCSASCSARSARCPRSPRSAAAGS